MGARLGQHFLTSPSALGNIVTAAALTPSDTALEIGPGKGVLTEALLKTGASVVAVEKDERLAVDLMKKFTDENRLRAVVGDIRNHTPEELALPKGYVIVANIPYYITGAIIRQFLTAREQPSRMVLLVQKEVAERVVGNPEQRRGARSKKESLLSLSVKAYGTPRIAARVPRGAFSPPPKVDSAVLLVENISRDTFKNAGVSEEQFFELLHIGFAQKRKMLLGNLATRYGREQVATMLTAVSLPHTVRAEEVPLSSWLGLARALGN